MLEDRSGQVTMPTVLKAYDQEGHSSFVWSILEYSKGEPFAATITFELGETSNQWIFARDLLKESLKGSTGFGDVTLEPSEDKAHRQVVHLKISNSDSYAVFELPRDLVSIFLEASEALVPYGQESKFLHLDEELAALLIGHYPRGL